VPDDPRAVARTWLSATALSRARFSATALTGSGAANILPPVANARFSSELIDEGGDRPTALPSLGRLLVAAIVLFAAGALLVWLFVFLIAKL